MHSRKTTLCVAVFGLLLSGSWLRARCKSYEVTTEHGVKVPMRDGVVLRAGIYRPEAEGGFSRTAAAHAV